MIRRLFLSAALALLSLAASAQALTTAQLATLKAYVDNDSALTSLRLAGNYDGVLTALRAPAVPTFVLWRTDVRAEETGNAWVGTDISGLSSLDMQRLQLLLASAPSGVFDMSRTDRRAGFESPFGTNQNNASRVAMRAVWKRSANVFEKLYAVGTGSDASPAVPGVGADGARIEGEVSLTVLVNLWR
jgi:hypothetical protein